MASADLIWYNSVNALYNNPELKGLPGFSNYQKFHDLFVYNLSLTDRFGAVKCPIKTVVAPQCKPIELKSFTHNYEELCVARARNFMDYAVRTGKKLYVLYSGGIDSSCIICSFLLACNEEELRNHLLVALTDLSIKENPSLYTNFIRRYLHCTNSFNFQKYLGHTDYVVITGEGNDQLFGSAVIGDLLSYGIDAIHAPVNNDVLFKCIDRKVCDYAASSKLLDILNNATSTAVVPLDTIFSYFWWLNFSLKWQSVYTRLLAYTLPENEATLQPDVNYFTFFNTPQFQLWSLNNQDKLIKNDWSSYKYMAKDFIQKVNPDDEYHTRKAKLGSLAYIITYQDSGTAVYEDCSVCRDPISPSYWDNNNDFV